MADILHVRYVGLRLTDALHAPVKPAADADRRSLDNFVTLARERTVADLEGKAAPPDSERDA